MKFNDLNTFAPPPSYRVHVPWRHVEENLAHWAEEKRSGKLDLEPDFQRLHVWTPDQQSAYLEYILSGGMSGREVYFNCVGWMGDFRGPFVIVDGKQRLEAVRKFMDNKVAVFGGHYLKDIEGKVPNDAHFIFCVNNLKTKAEVVKWYLEMNAGGTPHTAEEIAKARAIFEQCK